MSISLLSGTALAAVILLSGYSLVRLSRPEARQFELLLSTERASVIAISGIALTSWVALVLAEIGIFSLWLLVVLLALVSGAAWLLSNKIGAAQISFGRLDLVREISPLLLIAVLGIFLFFKPFEFIFGGWDAGVYVNTGFNIASTGAITIHDPLVSALGTEKGWGLFEKVPQPWYQSVRTLGFYIRDFSTGEIAPQFFHLYPVWIAILAASGGIKLAIFATPLFGLLGVLTVFLFARRAFDLPTALLGCLFLSLSAAQVWFARFPMAEVVVQTFLFSGLFCYVAMVDVNRTSLRRGDGTPSRLGNYLGVLSGVSLGLVHLTKIEMIFIAPVVVLLLGYLWIVRRLDSAHRCFAVAYLILLGHSVVHAVTISAPYTFDTFALVLGNWKLALSAAGLGLAAVIAIALLRERLARIVALLLSFHTPVSLAFIAVVAVAAGYAYFIRPETPTPEQFVTPTGLTFRTFKEENFIRFGWYVAPLGLLLGIVGFSQVVFQGINRRIFLFVAVAFLFSATFAWAGFVYSSHFWAARRLVPIVIPALLLLAAYAIVGSRPLSWTMSKAMLPAGLSALVLIPLIQGLGPLLPHVEYEGATERVAEMAQAFPTNSVILFEPSDPGVMLSTPVEIIFGRKSVLLPKASASNPQLGEIIGDWLRQGKKVYWVSAKGDTEIVARGYALAPISSVDISLAEFERPLHKFPSRASTVDLLSDVYEVVPGGERTTYLAANSLDDGYRWKGFYAPQQEGKEWFRWSKSEAEVSIPRADIGSSSHLIVRMARGTPRAGERVEAAIYVDDRLARKTVLPELMKSFAVPLANYDGGSGPDLRLKIVPSTVYDLKGGDEVREDRQVGVKVAWLAIKTIDHADVRR